MALVRVRNRFTKEQKSLEKSVALLLRDKFEIIGGDEEVESNSVEVSKVEESPNLVAAKEKETAAVNETVEAFNPEDVSKDELTLAREEYKELFGEMPHGRLKLESIKKLITEKKNG